MSTHTTTYHMPTITKGADRMTETELCEAISTLEAYEPPTRDAAAVKAHRLSGLYATMETRLRSQ